MTAKLYVAPVGTKAPTWLDEMEKQWVELVGDRYRYNVLGQWQYTPADELRDRLNDRLQGKAPAPAINTRYWRGP